MILYFSGTGNSAYVAKRIGNEIQDEVVNLFDKIRNHDFSQMQSSKPWVVVVPTYAWRIPRIVENWLSHTSFHGNNTIYFVMTCGANIGNAETYLKSLCLSKQMKFKGLFSVVMPENYIAMYRSPTTIESLKIIDNAEVVISNIIKVIKFEKAFLQQEITMKDKISSGFVNDVFYSLFVHAKKFYITDKCDSCGKCAHVCPLNNISIVQHKPVWGKQCTHCMACICGCHKEAIEYGKHTIGQLRYICPKRV